MPRNPNEARQRLQRAAVELFAENGFDQTTAVQIAARVGLTERTFFRHFASKPDVLFDSQRMLVEALTGSIAQAPVGLSPLETLRLALASIVGIFEENRPFSEPRQRIIAATPALQEREREKGAVLARTMADALQHRGATRQRAVLAAQIGLMVLSEALNAWFADPPSKLMDCIDTALAEVRDLAAPVDINPSR